MKCCFFIFRLLSMSVCMDLSVNGFGCEFVFFNLSLCLLPCLSHLCLTVCPCLCLRVCVYVQLGKWFRETDRQIDTLTT